MKLKYSAFIGFISILLLTQLAKAGGFEETFEDIIQLPMSGWVFDNRSDFAGDLSWSQGVESLFPAHDGPANSYILGGVGQTGGDILCDWLVLPDIGFVDQLNFYTRTANNSTGADRLVVVHSPTGGTNTGPCVDGNPGKGMAEDFGDFTPIFYVNEPLNTGAYPEEWTAFNVPVNGGGRLAFVYFVENVGQPPFNGNLIGIDSLSVGSSGSGSGTTARAVPGLNHFGLLLLFGLMIGVIKMRPLMK